MAVESRLRQIDSEAITIKTACLINPPVRMFRGLAVYEVRAKTYFSIPTSGVVSSSPNLCLRLITKVAQTECLGP